MSLNLEIHEIDWSLYIIIDKEWLEGRELKDVCEQMIRGGATIIQYRDKVSEGRDFYMNAIELRRVTKKKQIPLIINDRADIALGVEADGVHLGQEDISVEAARALVGDEMIVGGSVHDLSELEKMDGADYFGVGTVYPTQTKEGVKVGGLDIIKQIRALSDLPIVAIGGITPENLEPVIQAGADGVAVISAIMGSNDIEAATRRFVKTIKKIKLIDV